MIANGLGPHWFPSAWRRWLTALSALFFDEASWRVHDASYDAGDPARSVADFGFLKAMIRDAGRTSTVLKMVGSICLAFTFYILVRAFGWASYKRNKK